MVSFDFGEPFTKTVPKVFIVPVSSAAKLGSLYNAVARWRFLFFVMNCGRIVNFFRHVTPAV